MNTLTHPAFGLLNIALMAAALCLAGITLGWQLPAVLFGAALLVGIVAYLAARLKLNRAEAALQAGCARVAQEREGLEALRDQLIAEAARQVEVRAQFAKSRAGLEALRVRLAGEQAQLEAGKTALAREQAQLEASQSLLASDTAELTTARAQLTRDYQELEGARNKLVAEHSALIEARAALVEQKNALLQTRAWEGRSSRGAGAGKRSAIREAGAHVSSSHGSPTPFATEDCDLSQMRSYPARPARPAGVSVGETRGEATLFEAGSAEEGGDCANCLTMSGLTVSEVMESLVNDLEQAVPFATVVAFTMNDSLGRLELSGLAGMHKEVFSAPEVLNIAVWAAGRALASRQRLLTGGVVSDLHALGFTEGPRWMKGEFFPLFADQTLGVVALYTYAEEPVLTREVMQRVEEVCHLAIPSLQNAHLRLLAVTDGLTGLSNARHLMREGARLVKFRSDQRLSLLMMDLDGFKQVNDTFGHEVGDELLVAVARSLQPLIKPGELLCRKGGDEFVMILLDTDQDHYQSRVDRVREAIQRVSIPVGGGQEARVGVSIGVARAPDDCGSLRELMRLADTRMYKQKRSLARWPAHKDNDDEQLPFNMSA